MQGGANQNCRRKQPELSKDHQTARKCPELKSETSTARGGAYNHRVLHVRRLGSPRPRGTKSEPRCTACKSQNVQKLLVKPSLLKMQQKNTFTVGNTRQCCQPSTKLTIQPWHSACTQHYAERKKKTIRRNWTHEEGNKSIQTKESKLMCGSSAFMLWRSQPHKQKLTWSEYRRA